MLITILHLLVEHDPAHVLHVVEFLTFKELADLHDVLFFDPDEEYAIDHHTFRDNELLELLH